MIVASPSLQNLAVPGLMNEDYMTITRNAFGSNLKIVVVRRGSGIVIDHAIDGRDRFSYQQNSLNESACTLVRTGAAYSCLFGFGEHPVSCIRRHRAQPDQYRFAKAKETAKHTDFGTIDP
jgi:hypothetical protein